MGTTEGEAAKDIKALTGIDVTGFSQEISTHDIRHEDNRHGLPRKINKKKYGERRADQIPISTADFERIPDLLSDYDNIELGDPERNTCRPSVVYTKTYPDGVLFGLRLSLRMTRRCTTKPDGRKCYKKSRSSFRRMYEPPDDYALSAKPLRRRELYHT